jgi:hypothetical protein
VPAPYNYLSNVSLQPHLGPNSLLSVYLIVFCLFLCMKYNKKHIFLPDLRLGEKPNPEAKEELLLTASEGQCSSLRKLRGSY